MAVRNRRGRKWYLPPIENPVQCRMVPIAVPLIPFFRYFFETMQTSGVWADNASAERGREYFSWQEAMMLCNNAEQSANNTNKLLAVLISVLTGGEVPPGLLVWLLDNREVIEGNQLYETMMKYINPVSVIPRLAGRIDQLEDNMLRIGNLIGGADRIPIDVTPDPPLLTSPDWEEPTP